MDLPRSSSSTSPAADWAPVSACILPTTEQPLRVAEFDRLFGASLRSVEHPRASATRARLVLVGDEGLAARVRRLADAETTCCSFFAFTLTPLGRDQAGDTVVALDIEVPSAQSDVLAALMQRAERTVRAAS